MYSLIHANTGGKSQEQNYFKKRKIEKKVHIYV